MKYLRYTFDELSSNLNLPKGIKYVRASNNRQIIHIVYGEQAQTKTEETKEG